MANLGSPASCEYALLIPCPLGGGVRPVRPERSRHQPPAAPRATCASTAGARSSRGGSRPWAPAREDLSSLSSLAHAKRATSTRLLTLRRRRPPPRRRHADKMARIPPMRAGGVFGTQLRSGMQTIYDRVEQLDAGSLMAAGKAAKDAAEQSAVDAAGASHAAQAELAKAQAATQTTVEIHADAASINAKLDDILSRLAAIEAKPNAACTIL